MVKYLLLQFEIHGVMRAQINRFNSLQVAIQ
jgi:hypothetical protein